MIKSSDEHGLPDRVPYRTRKRQISQSRKTEENLPKIKIILDPLYEEYTLEAGIPQDDDTQMCASGMDPKDNQTEKTKKEITDKDRPGIPPNYHIPVKKIHEQSHEVGNSQILELQKKMRN